jgi:hypothetical protein
MVNLGTWNLYVPHDRSYQPEKTAQPMISGGVTGDATVIGGTDRLDNLLPYKSGMWRRQSRPTPTPALAKTQQSSKREPLPNWMYLCAVGISGIAHRNAKSGCSP